MRGQLSPDWRVGIQGVGNPMGICIVASQIPKPRRGVRMLSRGDGHIGQGLSQEG
jgi:hypothetical protein